MCVRMALSCVFCASDWEAKHSAEHATMETYRAPRGKLSDVREGTSSQEAGSLEGTRNDGSYTDLRPMDRIDSTARRQGSGSLRFSGDNGPASIAEGDEGRQIGSDVGRGRSLTTEQAIQRSAEATRRVSDEHTRRKSEEEQRSRRASEEAREQRMHDLVRSPSPPVEIMPKGPPLLRRLSTSAPPLPALPDCLA